MSSPSGPSVPPPRPPGTRVGRFVLGAPIAGGAMGAVYDATVAGTDERVALKLLHGAVDPEASARFQREARAASRVSHPGIVRVIEAGETDDGERFLAMERLEGETLEARMGRPDTSALALVTLLRGAVDALAAAHEAGIVHRDLKPSNLFLARSPDGDERVKLIDFGIAKDHRGTDPRLTATGIVLGTPFYMSPEQARAHRELGPATDVWAVGVMLYEAVTGAVPFAGDSVHDVVIRACTEAHRPLPAVAPGVDRDLAALVDDCLEKRPEARLADAATLGARLDAVLGRPAARAFLGQAPRGARPGAVGTGDATEQLVASAPGRAPRRRVAAAALGAIFALGGAGAALVSGLGGGAEGPGPDRQATPDQTGDAAGATVEAAATSGAAAGTAARTTAETAGQAGQIAPDADREVADIERDTPGEAGSNREAAPVQGEERRRRRAGRAPAAGAAAPGADGRPGRGVGIPAAEGSTTGGPAGAGDEADGEGSAPSPRGPGDGDGAPAVGGDPGESRAEPTPPGAAARGAAEAVPDQGSAGAGAAGAEATRDAAAERDGTATGGGNDDETLDGRGSSDPEPDEPPARPPFSSF